MTQDQETAQSESETQETTSDEVATVDAGDPVPADDQTPGTEPEATNPEDQGGITTRDEADEQEALIKAAQHVNMDLNPAQAPAPEGDHAAGSEAARYVCITHDERPMEPNPPNAKVRWDCGGGEGCVAAEA